MAVVTQIEPITDAVHLCIDVQNIFSRGGVWETPWMERVLPLIVEITARHAARTVFTRFITPTHPDERPGRWRRYFRKWQRATRAELPSSQLERSRAAAVCSAGGNYRQAGLFGLYRIAAGISFV